MKRLGLLVLFGFCASLAGCGERSNDFQTNLAEVAKAASEGKEGVKKAPRTKERAKVRGELADEDTF
jgi:hypothetical protein